MSDVYKKFTAQDYAVIPFNAHKQYNFTTSSYSDNSISYFNTSWTSESVSLYTSTSAFYGGDTKNVVKYYQLNHLFYKNFKADNANRFGNFNYLQQKRELNEKANILSIPTGLYGHEIKPGSLYISSSDTIMIDDKKGNLIVSGTNIDHYPTDIRSNIFNIGPTKGFKNLDLDVWKGYAVELKEPHVLHGELTKRFWRRGHHNPNAYSTYTTVSGSDLDDSYFFNSLKYYDINFSKSSSFLGRYDNNYSFLNFNSLIGSYITSPHNEKFNFNKENFSISFYMIPEGHSHITSSMVKPIKTGNRPIKPGSAIALRTSQQSTTTPQPPITYTTIPTNLKQGVLYKGGYIFHIDSSSNAGDCTYTAYIVDPNIYAGYNTQRIPHLRTGWGPGGTTVMNTPGLIQSNSIIGGGEAMTKAMAHSEGSSGFLGQYIKNNQFGNYTDWWLPNETELEKIADTFELPLQVEMGTCAEPNIQFNPISLLKYPDGEETGTPLTVFDINYQVGNALFTTESWGKSGSGTPGGTFRATTDPHAFHKLDFPNPNNTIKTEFPPINGVCKPPTLKLATSQETTDNKFLQFELEFVGTGANINDHTFLTKHNVNKQTQTNFSGANYNAIDASFMLVRKVCIGKNILDGGKGGDPLKRYIICKSTTKTVIPTAKSGKAQTYNTNLPNNLQPLDTQAEPQFPFEIYMKNNHLFFDRSDGNITSTISASITSSNTGNPNHLIHILCQVSGSDSAPHKFLQIYKDGTLIGHIKDSTIDANQNTANIYIGSKGKQSVTDSHGQKTIKNQSIPQINNDFRYYNGALSHINIWNRSFNTASIKNISESVNASPYIGNVFYQQGFTTITHPKYYKPLNTDLKSLGIGTIKVGSSFIVGNQDIGKVQFQGSHLIYENEYQCTVEEHEFNSTMNISARKIKSNTSNELADFATGSLFKPYVTTIGLYNEDNELLVVGKLGQPIRMSNETDTTFIMRWDT